MSNAANLTIEAVVAEALGESRGPQSDPCSQLTGGQALQVVLRHPRPTRHPRSTSPPPPHRRLLRPAVAGGPSRAVAICSPRSVPTRAHRAPTRVRPSSTEWASHWWAAEWAAQPDSDARALADLAHSQRSARTLAAPILANSLIGILVEVVLGFACLPAFWGLAEDLLLCSSSDFGSVRSAEGPAQPRAPYPTPGLGWPNRTLEAGALLLACWTQLEGLGHLSQLEGYRRSRPGMATLSARPVCAEAAAVGALRTGAAECSVLGHCPRRGYPLLLARCPLSNPCPLARPRVLLGLL